MATGRGRFDVSMLDPRAMTRIWSAAMTIGRFLERALRIVTVIAVTLALLSAPAGRSTSHDPMALAAAEAERHAELAAEIADHGHVHDDGDLDEQSPGHIHGHDPSDHLHDKAGVPPAFHVQASPATQHVTLTGLVGAGHEAPISGLKRPPRPCFAA